MLPEHSTLENILHNYPLCCLTYCNAINLFLELAKNCEIEAHEKKIEAFGSLEKI